MPAGQGVMYNTSGGVLSNSHIEFYMDEDEAVDIYIDIKDQKCSTF